MDDPPEGAGPERPDTSSLSGLPARLAEVAQGFSHSGTTYVLGWGSDFFAVWNRTDGGLAYSSKRTAKGWDRVWKWFVTHEPNFVQVGPTGLDLPFPTRKWSRLARAALLLSVASFAIAAYTRIPPVYRFSVCDPGHPCDRESLVGVFVGLVSAGIGGVAIWRITRSGGSLVGTGVAIIGIFLSLVPLLGILIQGL
jgi:hypothetical protein